jgi:predicted hydrocarbon binding protein
MAGNSILNNLVYDQSSGKLGYKNVRYILLRPETVVGLQKAIEAIDRQLAKDALFQGGFQGGYLSAKNYKEALNFGDQQIVEFMMEMGTEIGWGRFRLQDFDSQQKRLTTIVYKSPFAEAYGESPESVCHLIRGVLSGLASLLFSKNCVGSEIKCQAQGNEFCVFQIGG